MTTIPDEVRYRDIPDHILDGAKDGRDWFVAYLREGFTEEQALALVTRPFTVNNPLPERTRWWQR